MTRNEFFNDITDFYELRSFCSEYGCDCCEDVFDSEEQNEEIEYDIGEYHNEYSWRYLRDYLYDIPTNYDFYRKNGPFDWCGLDDNDFNSYRDDVYEWAYGNGYIDDDEDEEDEEYEEGEGIYDEEDDPFYIPQQPVEPDEPIPDEDFSISALMGMSATMLMTLQQVEMQRKHEADMEFAEFVTHNIPKALV